MAANKNVAPPPPALLVLLPLMMLMCTALAARNSPVGAVRLNLTPPFFHGPIARAPPPPATASAGADDDAPLRKVPRGPGHSPNDPSPPPPSAALVTEKLPLLIGEEVASEHPAGYMRPPAKDPIDAPEPPAKN
ncbi:hypothetical protein C2845_PM05G10690 [Panicum miliaceum]|uniref:Uncharacterized protein n=1 Tax=Panicum miliaceum TaxID=4540 RepID=A0A3L6SW58_PANMI|nr:hypothetical protein C2845_PM05G10690 [Panicum miliaceum]